MSTDIDLLIQREDGLHMAECKDKIDLENIEALQSQLLVGKRIASAIRASYTFATLDENPLPEQFHEFFHQQDIELVNRQQLLA